MTAAPMLMDQVEMKPVAMKNPKPIVVATDGSETAEAALKAAELISSRTGCFVRIVSALEPLPEIIPSVEGVIVPMDWEEVREKGQREIVTRQISAIEAFKDSPVDILLGKPCEAIADYARRHNAGLIIVGSNKHGVIGRILGEETAVDIARLSEVPLLVASPKMNRLPRRIIIGMSLDPDGMHNTAQALSLVANSPSVSCVHVQPRDEFLGVDWAQYDHEYQLAMSERFAEAEKSLLSAGLRPDLVFLHGNPAKEIVDFADYSKAELIVLDIRRKVGKSRSIGGRTARKIMRHAETSVLIVPNLLPRKPGERLAGATDVIADSRAWDSSMREFTRRNAGRLVNLEVDDLELGAIVEARNYPLIGVDYDHRDECLTIILGDVHGMERHLTRTVVKPTAVSILCGDGRDSALSVSHTGGQTLITF